MTAIKVNYYEILGLNQSATSAEIRRAYKILARRYHPDLNPGKSSEEKFKLISLAYQTLNDAEKRRKFDGDLDAARRIKAGFAAYEKAKNFRSNASYRSKADSKGPIRPPNRQANNQDNSLKNVKILQLLGKKLNKIQNIFKNKPNPKILGQQEVNTSKVSVIEVSISMQDALFGGRKTIEVPSEDTSKKISLRIPAGVRTGSVLRMRSGTLSLEDFIIILRVAPEPNIELQPKGVIVHLPINLSEAIFGATIKVPGINEEEEISIPAGTQTGQEIRVSGKGVKYDDGKRGDIFYRLEVHIPNSTQAVGIQEKVKALNEYYESSPRHNFPKQFKK